MSKSILHQADPSRFSNMDIDFGEGPNDFCDAYVKKGCIDGRELTSEEIDELNDEAIHASLLYELIVKNYY